MKKNVLLSIICPAYNAEESIPRLIESLVSQPFDDYELILINDGSKDNTWNIIEQYSKKFKNIIAINKNNTGVGDTRNEGLKIAKGKYITFADSDDWYEKNFFEKIIPEIEKEDFELLIFNANVMNYDKNIGPQIKNRFKSEYFHNTNGVIQYLNGNFCHRISNSPWNKIYVSQIIKDNKLKYEFNKKRGQDLIFNILYVSKIKKYKYIKDCLYNYALNMNIKTTKVYRNIEIEENLKFYSPLKKICEENKIKDYKQYLGLFFLRRFPGIVLNETNNENYDNGKQNINMYLEQKNIKSLFSNLKFKHLDFKLTICFLFYKLKCYNIIYNILWKRRHKKND